MATPRQLCDTFAAFCGSMHYLGKDPTHVYLTSDLEESDQLVEALTNDQRFLAPQVEMVDTRYMITMTLDTTPPLGRV